MALKVHKVVVVSCPRCVFSSSSGGSSSSSSPSGRALSRGSGLGSEGVGKSCFCNRFVRPDCFQLQHNSELSEEEWKDEPVFNGDHFLYWGAATKRMPDGSKVRFQVVEQTEFYNMDTPGAPLTSSTDQRGYIERASSTHFISRGKVAYRLHSEEEYAIPSSLKHNKSSRATQLFPNHEFSDGKASPPSFIVLYDPTLQGEDVKIQVEYLTKLVKELVKTKCKVIIACTKCDEVNEGRIQLGANLATTIAKKPLAFIETSAKEGINIEEAFSLVISTNKKKNYGKHISSYHEVIESRTKDTTYSTSSFNQLIKESVSNFSVEWSDIWPHLQANPACAKAVDVLGIKEAKKLFCQRLMELKVQELRGKKRLSSKAYQSELLDAFSNHPDLGNDSVYDFVYSPPSTPNSKGTCNPSSDAVTPPLATPTKTPTLPLDAISPPPPPPTSSIPSLSLDQTTPTKTTLFSPTRTGSLRESFNGMNRSSEILLNPPDLLEEIPRDASLRFRYRTLPPLPTQEHFSPTRRLSSTESITKSHPQLDESTSSYTSSGGGTTNPMLQRRLSNSMDCLLLETSGTLFEEEGENEDVDFNRRESECSEASPYLRPVDVRKAMEDLNSKQDKAASCKLPRPKPRPTIPFQDDSFVSSRSRSFRDRAFTSPQLMKQHRGYSNEALPPVPPSAPPLSTTHTGSPLPPPLPPPPTKKVSSLRKESPLLLGITSLVNTGSGNNDESSLDFPSGDGPRILIDSKREGGVAQTTIVDDTSSVGSGSFAEIDEPDNISGSFGGGGAITEDSYRSKSLTPDPSLHAYSSSTLPSRGYRSILLTPTNTLQVNSTQVSLSARTSPEKENLYASIPAAGDEEYLTMRAGISLEDILSGSNKPRSTSVPTAAQAVIGKLKSVTNITQRLSKDSSNGDKNRHQASPSPRHSRTVSELSHRQFQSFDEASSRSFVPIRPLPPSPSKIHRRNGKSAIGGPTKRKTSLTGDNNIYESIDENEEWLKQLRQERALRGQQKMEQFSSYDPHLATKCNTIMESFLQSPKVQELWLETVKSVIPDFTPPTEASIPPLSINPEYIISYMRQTGANQDASSTEVKEKLEEEEEEEEEEASRPPEREEELLHRKLTVTDSILIRMNRSLQQYSSGSSSSSSESESEESDDEESEEGGSSEVPLNVAWVSNHHTAAEGGDTLRSEAASSPLTLAIVHQQKTHEEEENDHILACDGVIREEEEEEEEESEEEEFTSNEEEVPIISDIVQSNEIIQSNPNYLHNLSPGQSKLNKRNEDQETSPIFFPQTQTSPSITTNGHLSICQLNSLDSGISASNGVADEMITD